MSIDPNTGGTWQQPPTPAYTQPATQPNQLQHGQQVPPVAAYGQPAPQAHYGQPAYQPQYAPAAYPQPGYAPNAYPQPGQPGGQYGSGAPMMPTAQAPGVGGVIVGTALLGVFGALFAASKAKYAAKLGLSGSKYWIAFGATLGVVWLVVLVLIMAASGSDAAGSGSEPGSRTGITAEVLQADIMVNGDFKAGDGSKAVVKAATCTSSNVNEGGVGTYRCMVDFSDGSRGSFEVTVGENGKWVTDNGN